MVVGYGFIKFRNGLFLNTEAQFTIQRNCQQLFPPAIQQLTVINRKVMYGFWPLIELYLLFIVLFFLRPAQIDLCTRGIILSAFIKHIVLLLGHPNCRRHASQIQQTTVTIVIRASFCPNTRRLAQYVYFLYRMVSPYFLQNDNLQIFVQNENA